MIFSAVPTSGTENAIYRLGDEMGVRLPYRPVKDDQLEKLGAEKVLNS